MCNAFCLKLCKKKSMQLKLFLPYKFASQKPLCRTGRTILALWLVNRHDFQLDLQRSLTRCLRVESATHLFLRKVACYAQKRMALYCAFGHAQLQRKQRSEFACFYNHFFWEKYEKLCNFELLLFENGRTYLTSFLIYCRKNCALSVSTNNHPRINVRKNRCSSNHTQLCFMWKSENNFIGIQDFKKLSNSSRITLNFISLLTLTSQLYEHCFHFRLY